MGGGAGDALVETRGARQLRREDHLRAGEERDRVVAAAAVARRLGAVLLRHLRLDALEGGVEGGPAVRGDGPLGVDLAVAAARAARGGAGELARVDRPAVLRARQARGERAVLSPGRLVPVGEARLE